MIRAISRSLDQKEPDLLFYDFRQAMSHQWFEKIFKQGDKNGPLSNGPNIIMDALAYILEDDQSQFTIKMKGIAKFVFAEDEAAKPDSLQKLGLKN